MEREAQSRIAVIGDYESEARVDSLDVHRHKFSIECDWREEDGCAPRHASAVNEQ